MRMFLLFVLALALPLPAQDPVLVNPKIVKVEFDMLAQGMTEPSITDGLDVYWGQSANREKSRD